MLKLLRDVLYAAAIFVLIYAAWKQEQKVNELESANHELIKYIYIQGSTIDAILENLR